MSCPACSDYMPALLASSPALARAWAALPRRRLAKGEALLRAGDMAEAVWFVESGLVRLYYASDQGLERNRSFHGEGHWVGAGLPPGPVRSPLTIEAIEPTGVVELSHAGLERWSAELPQVSTVVQQALAGVFSRQVQRESELLLLDAAERYRRFMAEYGELGRRIPLYQVAAYLGITNVALSRIRRRLRQAG